MIAYGIDHILLKAELYSGINFINSLSNKTVEN